MLMQDLELPKCIKTWVFYSPFLSKTLKSLTQLCQWRRSWMSRQLVAQMKGYSQSFRLWEVYCTFLITVIWQSNHSTTTSPSEILLYYNTTIAWLTYKDCVLWSICVLSVLGINLTFLSCLIHKQPRTAAGDIDFDLRLDSEGSEPCINTSLNLNIII